MIEEISTYLLCYTTFLFVYGCIRKILNVKDSLTIKSSVVILLLSAINYVSADYFPMYIKSIISLLTYFSVCKFVIKSSIYNSIISSVVFFTLILMYEMVLSVFVTIVIKSTIINYVESITLIKGIISLAVSILIYNTLNMKIIIKYVSYIKTCVEKLEIKMYYIILFPIVILSFVYLYIFMISPYNNVLYAILYFISIVLLLSYIIFSIYRYYSLNEMNNILKRNDEALQSIVNEYKMFKHNIRHELDCIKSLGIKKVNDVIDGYFDEYYATTNKNIDISKLPAGFQAIIYQKMIDYNKLNTQVVVDNYLVTEPLKELSIKKYTKLIESMGIIIDNAFENINDSRENYIYLLLLEDLNSYTLKCINYNNNEINIENLFSKIYSTKKNHSGVGLYYILNKTPFTIKTVVRDDKYIVNLKVKK